MTHTTTTGALRAGLLTATALLLAGTTQAHAAAPAQEAPATRVTAPHGPSGDWLLLTVTRADAPAGAADGTLLLCDPPRGHVRAAAACAELDAARGDIGAIPQRKSLCPMIHAPVTAQARGTWRGRPVQYEETFANACVMTSRTGTLFTPADATRA